MAMGSSITGSALTTPHLQIACKSSLLDPHKPRTVAVILDLYRWCSRQGDFSVDSSLDGGSRARKAQALKLNRVFEEFPYTPTKDTLSLPKPLSTQYSNSVSDGSRLRVAYQFDAAFEAVERWLVERAVLPIENSLGGSIHRNYDLLLRHQLHIVGEVKLAVRHCLLANHGVRLEGLKRVLSHPQALAQCEHTLTKIGLVREAVDDTAGAAKVLDHVAFHNLRDTGAVASATAARIYDLNILAEDIQDDSDNVTRFLMLAREPIIPHTGPSRLMHAVDGLIYQTSIVFSLEEGPGMLFKALAVFALRHINLTKIESRPLRKRKLRVSDDNNGSPKYFDYLFCVDYEASMADENAQNALRHLKEFATFLRVLGSYPVDTSLI